MSAANATYNSEDSSVVNVVEYQNKKDKNIRFLRPVVILRGSRFHSLQTCLMNSCTWALMILLLLVMCIMITAFLFPYPLRPSCLVSWSTATRSCNEARQVLFHKLMDWEQIHSDCNDCGKYKVLHYGGRRIVLAQNSSAAPDVPRALITLDFMDFHDKTISGRINTGCHVTAECQLRPVVWLLDGGASYCALHRLAMSSDFMGPSAIEHTEDPVCTQFSTAHCLKFSTQQPAEEDDIIKSLRPRSGRIQPLARQWNFSGSLVHELQPLPQPEHSGLGDMQQHPPQEMIPGKHILQPTAPQPAFSGNHDIRSTAPQQKYDGGAGDVQPHASQQKFPRGFDLQQSAKQQMLYESLDVHPTAPHQKIPGGNGDAQLHEPEPAVKTLFGVPL